MVSADAMVWAFHLHAGVTSRDISLSGCCVAGAYCARRQGIQPQRSGGLAALSGESRPERQGGTRLVVTLRTALADLLNGFEQGGIVAPSTFAGQDAGVHACQISSGPVR